MAEGEVVYMSIRFADEIVKEMETRDVSKDLEKHVTGEEFEKWLYGVEERQNSISHIFPYQVKVKSKMCCEGAKMDKNIYSLYKRIMKHDPKAIDEISSLEEAKDLIKMITGNIYLNGLTYQVEQEMMDKLVSGDKEA